MSAGPVAAIKAHANSDKPLGSTNKQPALNAATHSAMRPTTQGNEMVNVRSCTWRGATDIPMSKRFALHGARDHRVSRDSCRTSVKKS